MRNIMWVVEWSRTKHGRREIVNVFRYRRGARREVRMREPFYGGWHHISRFKRMKPLGEELKELNIPRTKGNWEP